MTDAELQAKVRAEIERCYQVAEAKLHRAFIRPEVRFDLRRRACGMADLRYQRIHINMPVLRADPDHVINVTAAHEAAHMVHHAVAPNDYLRGKRQQHGRQWQAIMRLFGIADPMRAYTPSLEVQAKLAPTVMRTHEYRCARCGHLCRVGPRQHAKMRRGTIYRHIGCGGAIDQYQRERQTLAA